MRATPVIRPWSRLSVGAAALGALSLLHLLWATGSSWPCRDRADLTDSVVGRRGSFPSAGACVAVAGALAVAGGAVAREGRSPGAGSRLLARACAGMFLLRGLLGLAGRTDLVSPGSSSPRFRSLDRRFYGPLCLALALLCVPAPRRAARPADAANSA